MSWQSIKETIRELLIPGGLLAGLILLFFNIVYHEYNYKPPKPPPEKPPENGEERKEPPPPPVPTLDDLLTLLGHDVDDSQSRQILQLLGEPDDETSNDTGTTRVFRKHGVDLRLDHRDQIYCITLASPHKTGYSKSDADLPENLTWGLSHREVRAHMATMRGFKEHSDSICAETDHQLCVVFDLAYDPVLGRTPIREISVGLLERDARYEDPPLPSPTSSVEPPPTPSAD